MKDPDRNPFIYGSKAYGERVARDVRSAARGGIPSTYEGRSVAREYQRTQRDRDQKFQQRMMQSNATSIGTRPMAGNQPQYDGRAESEGRGVSGAGLLQFACVVLGILGAVFASAHGVKSGAGLVISFVLAYGASFVALKYIKFLVGLAVLGYGLYFILHTIFGH
jgi:hypothetical protein